MTEPEQALRNIELVLDSCRDESFDELVGESAAMREVYALIRRISGLDASVLITGECGTGKKVVARTVHQYSSRTQQPFVAIHCAAIPEGLLESELFGDEQNEGNGAMRWRGAFERAAGGTLFLDEIGEVGLDLQAKLVHALQHREIRPAGGAGSTKVNVRIIASTRRDLEAEMKAGRFREDLFYRLSVIPIRLRPLRERPEDMPALVDAFLRKHGGGRARALEPDAIRALQHHPWRGNARELENVIERALALSDADRLGAADLPLDDPIDAAANETSLSLALAEAARARLSLRALQDRYIEQALAVVGGKKGEAARLLGIDRKTLYRRGDSSR